jgi:ATP-dependent protease ClpP protease subunit
VSGRIKQIRANVRPEWFKISAKAGEAAQVLIYGEIGDSWWGDSVSAAQFVRDLADIDAEEIDFHIHSPGGDVFDGLAIATAVRTHKAKTTAYVDGLAASAASVIAVAADEVVMALGAELMIHEAWGLSIGNAADMTKMADDLNHISANLATLYAAKAGGTAEDWRTAMLAETWYSAQEAVDAGLADRVDESKKTKDEAKNAFDLSIFAHAGRSDAPDPFVPSARNAVHPTSASGAAGGTPNPEGADMSDTLISGLRERLGISAEAELDDEGLLAAVDEALAEQAEPITPPSAALPAGLVAVEQGVLDQMRADAAQGREAREQQLQDRRTSLVNAAISDGRVAPSRFDHWLNALKADSGMEETLASLAPGLVPLAPKGYTGGVDESSDDDYTRLFGKEA